MRYKIKYNIINADGETIRQITIIDTGNKTENQRIAAAKARHLYAQCAVFLRIELAI
jgi:hypothetical protein